MRTVDEDVKLVLFNCKKSDSDALQLRAKLNGISKSELFRKLIREYLAENAK